MKSIFIAVIGTRRDRLQSAITTKTSTAVAALFITPTPGLTQAGSNDSTQKRSVTTPATTNLIEAIETVHATLPDI